jgi:hypothetical protein
MLLVAQEVAVEALMEMQVLLRKMALQTQVVVVAVGLVLVV